MKKLNFITLSCTVVVAVALLVGCASNSMTLKLDIYSPPDIDESAQANNIGDELDQRYDEESKAKTNKIQAKKLKEYIRFVANLQESIYAFSTNLTAIEETNNYPFFGRYESESSIDDEQMKEGAPRVKQLYKGMPFYTAYNLEPSINVMDKTEAFGHAIDSYKEALMTYSVEPVKTNYISIFVERSKFIHAMNEFKISGIYTTNDSIFVPMIIRYMAAYEKPEWTNINENISIPLVIPKYSVTNTPAFVKQSVFVPTNESPTFSFFITNKLIEIQTFETNVVTFYETYETGVVRVNQTNAVKVGDNIVLHTNNWIYKITQTPVKREITLPINGEAIITKLEPKKIEYPTNVLSSEIASSNGVYGRWFEANVPTVEFSMAEKPIIINVKTNINSRQIVLRTSYSTALFESLLPTANVSLNGVSGELFNDLVEQLDEDEKKVQAILDRDRDLDLDRLQDAGDPMWKTITHKDNQRYWNTYFITNGFFAQGNSGVVVVRDSPIHYRIQRANNNPTALVQSQLRISRALTDAAVDIIGAATGVKVQPFSNLGITGKQSAETGATNMTAVQMRVQLDEKWRVSTKSVNEIEAQLTSLLSLTNTVDIQAGLTNILSGAAKRFEK